MKVSLMFDVFSLDVCVRIFSPLQFILGGCKVMVPLGRHDTNGGLIYDLPVSTYRASKLASSQALQEALHKSKGKAEQNNLINPKPSLK